MSSSSSCEQRRGDRPGLAVADRVIVPLDDGATLTELPISSISRAARASSTVMSRTSTPVSWPLVDQRLRELEQPQRRAARQDVIELRVHEHAVVGDERDVHVRALADVAVGDR